jgi:hypothetical protein
MKKADHFKLKSFPLFLAAQSEVPMKYQVDEQRFTVEVKVHAGSLSPAKG